MPAYGPVPAGIIYCCKDQTGSVQDFARDPFQVITGHQMVLPPAEGPFDAVMEAAFSVRVGIDDLLRAVFLGDIRESALLFQNVRRWIVQEENEFPETVRLCLFKGGAETSQFPGNQLL